MFERIKEKVRQINEKDPYMKVQPLNLVAQYTVSLPKMDTEGRLRAVAYTKWQADYFYSKNHQDIPADVRKAIGEFEFKANRMNSHDMARKVLEQIGPPAEALKTFIGKSDRSNKYFHEQGVSAGTGEIKQSQRNKQAERQEQSEEISQGIRQ